MRRVLLRLLPVRAKRSLRRLLNQWHLQRFRRTAPRATTWDLLCFPIIDWDFRWQRPQQLLSQFADAGHRVFLFRIGDVLPPGGGAFAITPRRKNVWEITLGWPAPLDVNAGALDAANLAFFASTLETLRRELGIGEAVSLVHVATWTAAALQARERFGWTIVYDCMDDWSAFPGMQARLIEEERRLIAEADVVTVTSERLREKWGGVLIRNGADFDHFSKPSTQAPLPYAHPIVGYFGAIASWLDVDLVARVASQRPRVSFVLVGGVFDVDVAPLRALPNVHFLGQQPYAKMPGYLRDFDVCMIPFAVDEVTAATDPVKFYEYLSQGKPVVSTPMPELDAFRDLFYGFDELDAAIAENDPALRARRIEAARANTWPQRAAAMADAIHRSGTLRYPLASCPLP